MKNKKVLFVTWDGAEVTYLENLFAPVFLSLRDRYGYEFHVIQFTSADQEKIQQRKAHFVESGLPFISIKVDPRFPVLSILKARYWDIRIIKKYIKIHQIDVLMPRAINSLFITYPLAVSSSLKLVFDADGFPLEERVDFAGLSPDSWRYRYFSKLESSGYNQADAIICRSRRAEEVILDRGGLKLDRQKIVVINNGTIVRAGKEEFIRKRSEPLVLVYAGSLGPQYHFKEMLQTFAIIRTAFPLARFKILTFKELQAREFIRNHFPELASWTEVKSVPALAVKQELESADVGISFRKKSFSMRGVAPIKVSEYLGAGLSVIYNPGIGDLDELLQRLPFAFSLDVETGMADHRLIEWLRDQVGNDYLADIRKFAQENFSLDRTVDLYHQALQYADE